MKDESLNKAKLSKKDRKDMIQYINLQLAALAQPLYYDDNDAKTKLSNAKFISLTEGLISSLGRTRAFYLTIFHRLTPVFRIF
jgi:phosphoenolpyruvate carboxykinase (diphosphate)